MDRIASAKKRSEEKRLQAKSEHKAASLFRAIAAAIAALGPVAWAISAYWIEREKQRSKVELARLEMETKKARTTTTGLPDFFKYNLWANLRLLDACACLSEAQMDATTIGTYGSVRETLMHLFAAEENYVRHFTGTSPTPRLKELTAFPGLDELRRRAEISGKELITIAEQRDLNQIFYLDDGTYEAPAIIVLIQAINHAIDHRSQIATLLSQQSIEPSDLDGWSYNDAIH